MLKLLAFRCVVCNVGCNIGRKFEADCSVQFHQSHFAIEIEAQQLIKYHVMRLPEKRAYQFQAVRSRGAKVLVAQVVQLSDNDFWTNRQNLRN